MTPEQQAAAGITNGLLRLSVGIEATEDLVEDLGCALDRVLECVPAAV
jgi:cystathionine gamma-synthase